MQVRVSFDDALLSEYQNRGSSSFFGIHIVIGNTTFPDDQWMDFGSVVLGWWIMECINLSEGQDSATLSFMDGPYSVRVSRAGDRDILKCESQSGVILGNTTVAEMIDAVKDAANEVVRYLSKVDVDAQGRESLLIGLSDLNRFTVE